MASTIAKTKDGIGRTNTRVANIDGRFTVILWSTMVYEEDLDLGIITLNNGGWVTPTTARRMNQALAHRGFDLKVSIRKGAMFLHAPQTATKFEGQQLIIRTPKSVAL